MDCSSDDGEVPFGDAEWAEELAADRERAEAEAEAAALGLFEDEQPDVRLPLVDNSPNSSASSVIVTPPRRPVCEVLENSVPKREAPAVKDDISHRKRIRGKQSASNQRGPQVLQGIVIDGKSLKAHPVFVRYWKVDPGARRLASKRLSQQKYRLVNDLVRQGSVEIFGETLTYGGDKSEATSQVEYKFFLGVAMDESKNAVDRGYAMSQLAQYERDNGLGCLDNTSTPTVRNVPSALLTYVGQVGIVDIDSGPVPSAGRPQRSDGVSVEEKFRILRSMHVDDVAALLRSSSQVQKFFGQLETQAVNAVNRLHTPHWAVTVEVCPKTLASSDVLRVHGHVWISLKGQALELTSVAVDDGKCVPFANWQALKFLSGTSARSAASAMAGAFYCTLVKKGTIIQKSTCLPWRDFSIRDVWVTSMYASDKITFQVAREAYLRTVHRAAANVAQLEYCHKERQKIALQGRIRRIEEEIRGTFLPWKAVPAVQHWQRQYLLTSGRYLFLVLDGKSCYGKTKYAFGLNAVDRTYYCDCTSGVPDLRDFDAERHIAVIFDELSPQAGIRLKKCLQASNEPVVMAVSPTMVSSYVVHLWRTQLIVCTNLWAAGLKKMKKVDREWLINNSVYVSVQEPLWCES